LNGQPALHLIEPIDLSELDIQRAEFAVWGENYFVRTKCDKRPRAFAFAGYDYRKMLIFLS
jgi:hypothetical protein